MFQCQYETIRAPRATSSHVAWRHCPSYGDSLIDENPIEPALVSVTKKGAWRDEYIRSASWLMAHGPRTTQPISPTAISEVLGWLKESAIS